MSGNEIAAGSVGLYLDTWAAVLSPTVTNNTITDNGGDGIFAYLWGTDLGGAFSDNSITENAGDGMDIKIAWSGGIWNTGPTSVDLASFEALWDGSSVTVLWETRSEVDHEGFHLWRSAGPASPRSRPARSRTEETFSGGLELIRLHRMARKRWILSPGAGRIHFGNTSLMPLDDEELFPSPVIACERSRKPAGFTTWTCIGA